MIFLCEWSQTKGLWLCCAVILSRNLCRMVKELGMAFLRKGYLRVNKSQQLM